MIVGALVAATIVTVLVVILTAPRSADVAEASPSVTASASAAATVSVSPAASASTSVAPTPTAPPAIETMVAVGDLASCAVETDEAVAAAVAAEDADAIALLGDLVYPNGNGETYRDCFLPAWSALLELARPAPGNHDLIADGGAAYWALFGDRAGRPGEGWYSYDLGDWHVVVLNSNCELIACTPGSPQHDWLVTDLAATEARCVLAYWHHPMVGSGEHGRYPPVDPLWTASVEGGVDLALAGHEHFYERLVPLGADVAPANDGVQMMIVGTGGIELRPQQAVLAESELVIDDAFGYLHLELAPDAYSFEFVTLDGSVLDSGSGSCR